jgi:hypothetical protein
MAKAFNPATKERVLLGVYHVLGRLPFYRS